jgi:hypothetical protein
MEQHTTKIPIITIHTQAMAGYLMMRRFILIDKREDLKDAKLNVFIFKDSDEIRKAMSQYSNHKIEIDKVIYK